MLRKLLEMLLNVWAMFVKHLSNFLEMLPGHALQVAAFGGNPRWIAARLAVCASHCKHVKHI